MLVEELLPVMAERRMAQIMAQSNGFQEVEVETEEPADRAADLGDLHGVYRPVRYMLVELGSEIDHLGFAYISAESATV